MVSLKSERVRFNHIIPYNNVAVIFADCSVIHDAREWRYFKMLNGVTTPVEEQLFSAGSSDKPQIFLRPKESVHVPFRFLTFHTDHSVPDQAPSDPYRPFCQDAAMLSHNKNVTDRLESHRIKVNAQLFVFDTMAILFYIEILCECSNTVCVGTLVASCLQKVQFPQTIYFWQASLAFSNS